MNLLRDKRDDERPLETTSEGSLSEDQFQPAEARIKEKPVQKREKSKNTLSTLLIAAAIFIIAILVTYFGFYKQKEGGELPGAATTAEIDSSETIVESGSPAETTASDVTQTQTRQAAPGESSLKTASDVMQNIQNALGSGRVTAFFLDDGSFSAEVDAASVDEATGIYNAVKSALPAHASLTSSAPTGPNALIAGAFDAGSVSQPSGLSKDEIDSALRQLSNDAGTTVSSLAIDAPAGEQSFIVMRVTGSFEICRIFVEKLSQKSWNVSVSKLILLPGVGDGYTFVLRFYM